MVGDARPSFESPTGSPAGAAAAWRGGRSLVKCLLFFGVFREV
jgi:hypothetical protein